ncbi:terminase small subunit [Hymenobacter sp. HSC-4F20]|uniref:terminase small subunit n=1 Tax=Hymenobacter sp. HSC-4F20 TaxID=2864135 RepID=UPI001C73201A|nr:terminase small subunit [Hymenobacter sp. HSC-4F20]MBX0293136.1 terminase small subunit [Hymenobacter sp. HSC-4F20]
MATEQPSQPELPADTRPLTDQQKRFVDDYAQHWKGAQAARTAKYSESRAKQTARDLLKDDRILAAIKARAIELGMSQEEATVRMSQWGRASIEDVMEKVVVEYTPRIHKPLKDIVAEFKDQMEFEQEVAIATEALLSGKAQTKYRKRAQSVRQMKKIELLRMEMELARNPKAKRWVNGETVPKEEVRLSLVKVLEAKAGGMIKKITPTRYGMSVELHDAKDATTTMLKVLGAFAPVKVDHTTNGNDMPGSNIMMPDNGRD